MTLACIVKCFLGQKAECWQDLEDSACGPVVCYFFIFLLFPTVVLVDVSCAQCLSVLAEVVVRQGTVRCWLGQTACSVGGSVV